MSFKHAWSTWGGNHRSRWRAKAVTCQSILKVFKWLYMCRLLKQLPQCHCSPRANDWTHQCQGAIVSNLEMLCPVVSGDLTLDEQIATLGWIISSVSVSSMDLVLFLLRTRRGPRLGSRSRVLPCPFVPQLLAFAIQQPFYTPWQPEAQQNFITVCSSKILGEDEYAIIGMKLVIIWLATLLDK